MCLYYEGSTRTGANKIVQMSDCVCLGHNVTFECTVCGDGATVWSGTLLHDACEPDTFVLRHNSFESGLECNNLAIRSTRISLDNNGHQYFTSQLSFVANSSHDNKTVVCSHQSGPNETIINNVSIAITRGTCIIIMCSMVINSKFVFRSLASP